MAAAAAVTGTLVDVRKLPVLQDLPPALDWDGVIENDDYRPEWAMKDGSPAAAVGGSDGAKDGEAAVAPASSKEGEGGGGGGAGMEKFTTLKGIAAKLDIQNIDTDMIIPKQFLKTIKRTGLGVSAFYELRYNPEDDSPRSDFVLNQPPYDQSKILVCGDNFGCGSSREHAPWSILDFGVRCLIGTSFADIFYNNCFKNGMLPIKLPEPDVRDLMSDCDAGLEIEVDLEAQVIRRADGGGEIPFEVDAFRKHCLVNGLDDIGLTLEKAESIDSYEEKREAEAPWTFSASQLVSGSA